MNIEANCACEACIGQSCTCGCRGKPADCACGPECTCLGAGCRCGR